jgi:acyl dehydratase
VEGGRAAAPRPVRGGDPVGHGDPARWSRQRGWFLEDAVPGTVLRHPGGRTVDEAEHVWLAWLTSNVSDVHGNADAAARGPWGRPLVLGALTASIVIGLATPAVGPPGIGDAGWSDGWTSVRLSGPVVAGDTLRAESVIHAVIGPPGAPTGRVRRTIVGRNQRNEIVATIEEEREVPRRGESGGRSGIDPTRGPSPGAAGPATSPASLRSPG